MGGKKGQEEQDLPKRRQASLKLGARIPVRHAERAAQREAQRANQVPERNVPTQEARGWDVPFGLRLEHVQRAGDDEAGAAYHLRDPVRGVEHVLGRQVVDDPRQRGDARDAEDGRAKQLRRPREETQFVQVVRA